MSTPARRTNLARIRDNQRRSRARRRQHVQDLEQRLRACDLQGIEATAEVQIAARKVIEENKRLRRLLTKCGVNDECVAHYLQSGTLDSSDCAASGQAFRASELGSEAQSLKLLLEPRRPAALERTDMVFSLQSQPSRPTSINSASTVSSSGWDSNETTLASYGPQSPGTVPPSVMDPTCQPLFSPPAFAVSATPARQDVFTGQAHGPLPGDPHAASIVAAQQVAMDSRNSMNFGYLVAAYSDPTLHN